MSDLFVRASVRIQIRIEHLEAKVRKRVKTSTIQRLNNTTTLFFYYVLSAVFFSFSVLFHSPSKSFQEYSFLDKEKGYTSSYSDYRLWNRRVKTSAGLSSTVLFVLVTGFIGNFIIKGDLDVFAADYAVSCTGTAGSPTAIAEATYGSSDTLTLSDGGGDGYCELDEALTVGTLTVNTGVVLTHTAEDTDGVTVTATNVTVASGATIDVSEKGYAGNSNNSNGDVGDGSGTGGGTGSEGFTNRGGGGGGYGGDGGDSEGSTHPGGASYGDADAPAALGSGGGRVRYYCNPNYETGVGGDGGGFISITATGAVDISGTITANGGDGSANACSSNALGGGGSGGGVYISAGTLAGSGTISANGGSSYTTGAVENGGGGGGGRIYIVHSSTSTYAGTTSVSGGQGYNNGDDGTVAIYDSGNSNINIYDGFDFTTDDATVTYNDMTVVDSDSRIRFYGASAGLSLSVANLVSPAASTWTCMDSPVDITLAASTALDLDGITWTACDDVTVTRTSNAALTVSSFTLTSATGDISMDISDELTLSSSSITTTTRQKGLTLTSPTSVTLTNSNISANIASLSTVDMTVDSNSSITANALGERGGYGSSNSVKDGFGDGGGTGSDGFNNNGGGGGAYGGAGGSTTNHAGGSTYGSATNPTDYGSGGGRGRVYCAAYTTAPGGDGGGKIILSVSGTFDMDGVISANGGGGQEGCSEHHLGGAGSGGSVNIAATTFSGTGTISANGGSSYTDGRIENGGGGGGGRIRYGYVSAIGWSGTSQVSGGTGYASGSDGTVDTLVLTAATQPSITSPTTDTYNNSVNIALTASTYASNGAGHTTSTWTIYSDSGGENVVWQASNNASNLESIVVNDTNGSFQGALTGETTLASNTTYYASVYYTNGAGNSTAASLLPFTTAFTGTTTSVDVDYASSAAYSYNTSYVEFVDGVARLKDQGASTYANTGLSGFSKRQPVTITNSTANEGTNFQVRAVVPYDSDMQTDYDDIRFTSSDGLTELDYWFDRVDDAGTGEDSSDDNGYVYVEVPTLAASGDTDVYMYYGNSGASSNSSGADTFVFFDDFETYTGWTDFSSGGSASQSSTYAYNGTYSLEKNTASDPYGVYKLIGSTLDRSDRYIFEFAAYRPSSFNGGSADRFGLEDSNENGYSFNFAHNSTPVQLKSDIRSSGTASVSNSQDLAADILDTWYLGQLIIKSGETDFVILDDEYSEVNRLDTTQAGVTSFDRIAVRGGYEYYLDDLRIRKYETSEPSVAFSTEESTASLYSNVTVAVDSNGIHPTYDTLFSFTETRPDSDPGNVYYQISNDGSTWYHHDGSSWSAVSNPAADYDDATTINQYLPDFPSDVGTGEFYVRAILSGDGSQQVGVSNIGLKFNANPAASTITSQTLTEDTDVTGKFDLDSFFTDVGDTLTYSALDDFDASLGSMTINGDGTVDFDLADNASGSDTIQFRATDQTGATVDSNSVTVTVNAVNDAPSASISASDSSPTEDDTSITLNANASDVENDLLSYVWAELLDASDACSLTNPTSATPTVSIANKDSNYTCQYRVTVSDGSASSQDTITMNITADNDAPTITTITDKEVNEGQQLSFVVDSDDPDSTPTLSARDAQGDFAEKGITINNLFEDNEDSTGVFSWRPQSDESGTYVAQFRADDSVTVTNELVTITVNDTVNDAENSSPAFGNARIPNVSFAAGVRTSILFDLDEYFSDDDNETLSYSVTGNERIEVYIDEEGQVTMEAPASFAGTEAFNFVAEDAVGDTAISNAVIITVTETIPEDDINVVLGKSKGKGVITVKDENGNEVASWQAFKKGGVIPRVETVRGNTYVFATKSKPGSTIHAYTSQGSIIKKKKISKKLHYRKLSTGSLDDSKSTAEITVATKRGSTIYFKIFAFNPEKKRLVLKKRARYRGIKGKNFRTVIQKGRIKLINKKGKTKFIWQPFN